MKDIHLQGFSYTEYDTGPWLWLATGNDTNGTDSTQWVGIAEPGMLQLWSLNVSFSHLFISATLDLGVWRHICLGLDFKEGQIILVENAELRRDLREQEKMAEMFENFSSTLSSISVGCGSSKSTIGRISDFQIWDSVLPLDKMLAITGCKETLEGNFLSWEGTDWQLNSSSGAMELEMHFDDICEGGQGSSLALIPYTMSMVPRALHQCSRLGGQVAGYTDQAEFHSIARFLSSRWVDLEN